MNTSTARILALVAILCVSALALTTAVSAQAGASTAVELTPSNQTVAPGSAVTYDVVATNAPDGIQSYGFTVSTTDTPTATISDASFGGSPAGSTGNINVAADNSFVAVTGGFAGISAGTDVVLGTVTVKGNATGTADLNVTVNNLIDSNNAEMTVTSLNNATVTTGSIGPGDVTGDGNPALDPDGDGLYEDVNGDSVANSTDVQALKSYVNTSGTDLGFDFDGDGDLDLDDAQSLSTEVGSSSGTSPGSGGSQVVTFTPTQQTVAAGGTTTYEIVLTSAPDGVSTYAYTVTSDDANTATLTDFSFGGSPSPSTRSASFSSTNETLTVSGGLAGISAGSNVTLGTVTVAGNNTGSTNIGLSLTTLLDGNNDNVNANIQNGTVTVQAGPGDLTGDGRPATDPDSDGVYEDINGDGSADLRDLQPFFNLVKPGGSPLSSPRFVDFNGDGSAGLRDLQPFFNEVRP
jgi:hypothetical protein